MTSEQEVISKEACVECQEEGLDSAGDNLVTFRSGVQYCVARHGTMGMNKENRALLIPKVDKVIKASSDLYEGEYPNTPIRNISPKTFEFYGYQINKEKQCHIANYYNEAGQAVMQQIRDAQKNFPLRGDTSYNNTLYGAHLFTPDERVFITITEGQLDALSIAEAFDRKYPVVSLPNGCQTAPKVLLANQKYLSGFKYVVLAFDNDGPGQDAINQCLKLFEPGKLRIVKWTRKDANEHLKENEHSIIRNLVYNAVEYMPEPVLSGDVWLKSLEGYQRTTRAWPWPETWGLIQPMSIPGIYTLASAPGVGKTQVVADLIKHAINVTGRVGVISLEESAQTLLIKIADMLNGTKLAEVSNRAYTSEEIELCRKTTEQVVTYDQRTFGSSLETILDNLPYIVNSIGCDTVIFDNLSFAATNETDDERRALDKSIIRLKDSTTKYNYLLINVCHTNSDNSDYKTATIRGSRGIMMYSDMVIHLGREVESTDPTIRNTLNFYIKKDRLTGKDTGKSFSLSYNPITRSFKGPLL